jgi:head-tail adaptor
MNLYRDRVAVLRAELVESGYGQVRDWAHQRTVFASLPASVQPLKSDASGRKPDEDPGRETGIITYRVYTPGQVDIRVSDRVRYRGVVYEVAGTSVVWAAVTGPRAYTLVLLRAVSG